MLKEILAPWYAHKLEAILRERAWKITGILNGIDTVSYDPAADPDLYAPYSVQDRSGKALNKRELQARLAWRRTRRPADWHGYSNGGSTRGWI